MNWFASPPTDPREIWRQRVLMSTCGIADADVERMIDWLVTSPPRASVWHAIHAVLGTPVCYCSPCSRDRGER